MCCGLLVLVLLGPRVAGVLWWLFDIPRWQGVFQNWMGWWWLWPALGLLILPWTTLIYLIIGGGGLAGMDLLWIVIGLIADIGFGAGGIFRKRIPQYQGV